MTKPLNALAIDSYFFAVKRLNKCRYRISMFKPQEMHAIGQSVSKKVTFQRLATTIHVWYCITGWWLGHPSEKYEFVNWDDESNPILTGKLKMATSCHQPDSCLVLHKCVFSLFSGVFDLSKQKSRAKNCLRPSLGARPDRIQLD